jgi:hypothetical protein
VNTFRALWQLLGGLLFVLVLISFAGMGIAHVINPDWFIKRSGVRKGGEVLGKWNRDSFRVVGVVFTAVAIYIYTNYFAGISAMLTLFDLRSSA